MNFLPILLCTLAGMAVGFVWYGPLFGKVWMRVMGHEGPKPTKEEMKEMNKKMMPTYIIQFILIMLQVWVLSFFVGLGISDPIHLAFGLWLGFIMPTVAGIAMWSGKSRGLTWSMFLTSAGFQLVSIVVFALILGAF